MSLYNANLYYMVVIIILIVFALMVLLLGFFDIKIPFISGRQYLKSKKDTTNKKTSLSGGKITKVSKENVSRKTTLLKQRTDEHSFYEDESSNLF